MGGAFITRQQLHNATTTSPWTKNFRHLLSFPRHWLIRRTIRDPYVKAVPTKARIKYWNIVPGDQIRVRGESEGTIHEVLSINRMSNRVFLKGIVNEGEKKKTPTDALPPSRNVHYSRCQLFIGNYDFPPREGADKPTITPVFALRLGRTEPYWQPMGRRWEWERVVAKTTPPLPNESADDRIVVPWPKPEKPTLPSPTMYETNQETVMEVTYKIPPLPTSLKGPLPKPPEESAYIKTLFQEQPAPFHGPVEVHLYKELSNPHSRAKKQARWQNHKIRTQNLQDDQVRDELNNLNGRTVREARAEAIWKWRQRLDDEKEAERKRRWKNKGSEARMVRKKARKARKEQKQRQRLTEMVLQDEPNQFIPKKTVNVVDS